MPPFKKQIGNFVNKKIAEITPKTTKTIEVVQTDDGLELNVIGDLIGGNDELMPETTDHPDRHPYEVTIDPNNNKQIIVGARRPGGSGGELFEFTDHIACATANSFFDTPAVLNVAPQFVTDGPQIFYVFVEAHYNLATNSFEPGSPTHVASDTYLNNTLGIAGVNVMTYNIPIAMVITNNYSDPDDGQLTWVYQLEFNHINIDFSPYAGEDTPPFPGCGLEVDGVTWAVKPEDLEGPALGVNAMTDCGLEVLVDDITIGIDGNNELEWLGACVDDVTISGSGLPGDCLTVIGAPAIVITGCGVDGDGSVGDPVVINNADLIDALGGLEVGAGTCDLAIKIDPRCGAGTALSVGVNGLDFDIGAIIGDGLEEAPACQLNIKIDDVCDPDPLLSVSADGLAFEPANLLLAAGGLENVFNCQINIKIDDVCDPNPTLTLSADGLRIDADNLAGEGLEGGTFGCVIKFAFDTLSQSIIEPYADLIAFQDNGTGEHFTNSLENLLGAFDEHDATETQFLMEIANDQIEWREMGAGLELLSTQIQVEEGPGIDVSTADGVKLDIIDLAIAVPSESGDYFAFGGTLGADNERVNLNGMMDAVLTTITVITDIELDGSNNLRIKTTQFDVYNPQTESSFSIVDGWATETC